MGHKPQDCSLWYRGVYMRWYLPSRSVDNMRGCVYAVWGIALQIKRPAVALNLRSEALSMSSFGVDTSRRPQDNKLKFIVTLERATGAKNVDRDEDSWTSGVFDAEVHPDLPPARKTTNLVARYAQRAINERVLGTRPSSLEKVSDTAEEVTSKKTSSGGSGLRHVRGREGYLVRSVPVQTSGREALQRRLAAAAGVDANGAMLADARPADALLLLSGSHPGRHLPIFGWSLPDVYDELRLATRMRDSGLLPEGLAFWAVANPLTEASDEGVDRLRRKVQLGAEVILTQPPLAWQPFERWLRGVHLSGALRGGMPGHNNKDSVHKATAPSHTPLADEQQNKSAGGATLLIGMPVITSPKGLRFWLELCGVEHHRSICKEAFKAFETPDENNAGRRPRSSGLDGPRHTTGNMTAHTDEATEKEVLPYGQAWFETTMSYLRCLDGAGVAGVHVMAPGPGPRRRTKSLIDAGIFGPRRE